MGIIRWEPGEIHPQWVTTYFIGGHYEVTGSTVTKYYFAGAQRVAMRTGSTLSYLLSDHLGSTSITTNSSGGLVSELRYKPWGETRYASGTTATKYQYTGQYSNMSDFGLMFYNARWYASRRRTPSSPAGCRGGIGMHMSIIRLLDMLTHQDIHQHV